MAVLECNLNPVFKVVSSSQQRKRLFVVNLEKVGQELSGEKHMMWGVHRGGIYVGGGQCVRCFSHMLSE